MTISKRQAIALLVTSECLLLVVAFVAYGSQGNPAQDQPIALSAVLTVMLGVGNVIGLLIALLAYAATMIRKHRRA